MAGGDFDDRSLQIQMPNEHSQPQLMASLIGFTMVLSGLGCARQPGECDAISEQAIHGGSPDASAIGLDDVAATAVAAIVVESDAGAPGLCSGVLVANRFVLTAAHCAPRAGATAMHVSFGPSAAPFASGNPCAPPAPTYPAVALHRDPDADVMLLELASDVSLGPVPIASSSPGIGQTAVIAGYGLTEQGSPGVKLYAETTVIAVGPAVASDSGAHGESDSDACASDVDGATCAGGRLLITIDSGTDAGACAGDSGGPLLVRGPSGWQVAGVLSEGSAYCTGEDVYVDLSSVAPWISAHLGL